MKFIYYLQGLPHPLRLLLRLQHGVQRQVQEMSRVYTESAAQSGLESQAAYSHVTFEEAA